MTDTEQQRRTLKLGRQIRRALFWARVQTAMLVVFAAASIAVAIEAILGWLR